MIRLKASSSFRIDCQTEIGDYIFYFLTLIERQSAVNAIRHAAFAHGFLEDAALRVGTIEYGKVGISVILLPAQFGYLVDYNIALFHITVCLVHTNGLSLLLFREHFLAYLHWFFSIRLLAARTMVWVER
mgnify:CR=1 FL=1